MATIAEEPIVEKVVEKERVIRKKKPLREIPILLRSRKAALVSWGICAAILSINYYRHGALLAYPAGPGVFYTGREDILSFFAMAALALGLRAWTWPNLCALAVKGGIKKEGTIRKFAENMAFVWFYVPVFLWGLGLTLYYNMAFPIANMFVGYPMEQRVFPWAVKLYISMEMGFYLHAMVVESSGEHRKDHFEMMLHHCITLVLIGAAFFGNFQFSGVLIPALHDLADAFLYVAKVLHYLDWEPACSIVFGSFALVWFLTRLLFFPRVVWLYHFDGPKYFTWDPENGGYYGLGYRSFTLLLLVLIVLHMYWFALIINMIRDQLKADGRVQQDIRSDDESDSD